MKKTDKYQFNLIESGDTFSPDALNANTEQLEDALITHEAAVDSALNAQKLEWQAADSSLNAANTALSQTVTANKTTLEQSIASAKSTLEKADADNKTALEKALADQKSALQAADAALQTAIGSGGKTARIKWGSYTGTGKSVTVDFKPLVLFVGYVNNSGFNRIHITFRNYNSSVSANYTLTSVTWNNNSVSWSTYENDQISSTTNYYVVIGESA